MLATMLLVAMQLVAAQPGNCLSGDVGDQRRLSCAEADYNATDAEMTKVYASTLERYKGYPQIEQRLKEVHASFAQQRENSCPVKAGPDTATLYRAVKLECMANYTRLEISALQEDEPTP